MKQKPQRVRIDLPTWLKVVLILAVVVALMLLVDHVLGADDRARELYR